MFVLDKWKHKHSHATDDLTPYLHLQDYRVTQNRPANVTNNLVTIRVTPDTQHVTHDKVE